jgi:hypothetical protein
MSCWKTRVRILLIGCSPMHAALVIAPLLLAVALATTGCLSPHGGLRLPFAGEPKPQVYSGDGRSYESALRVRRVKEGDLPYLEESWASYYHRYRTSPAQAPSLEDFRRRVTRETERVGGRVYHVLTFADADGKPQVVYFDVTRIVHD